MHKVHWFIFTMTAEARQWYCMSLHHQCVHFVLHDLHTYFFNYIVQVPCTFRPLCCVLKLFGIIYIYTTGRNLALWIAQIAGFFKFNPNPAQGVQYHMSRCPEWSHKRHTATQCFHIQAWWIDVKLLFAIDTKHALQCKHVSKIQALRLQIPWRGSSVLRTWNVPVFCVNAKDSRRTMLSRIGSVSY